MIIAVMNAILSNCVKKPEKVRTSTGFEPVTSRYRCDALTNWAMKPLTLGAGHLWVLMSPSRMDMKWYMKCFIYMKHFIYHFKTSNERFIIQHAKFLCACGRIFTGNAWQKYAKRNGIRLHCCVAVSVCFNKWWNFTVVQLRFFARFI